MADTQQLHQIGMPSGLGQNSPARIDEDDGGIGRRGTRDHVAGILLVTWRIGYDELALLSREEPVRHVYRDPLLAFGS